MTRLKKSNTVLCTIVCFLLISTSADSQQASREKRELAMADQAILASIAVSVSPNGQRICKESPLACIGPDKAELGLALIGARSTRNANLALVDLLGYRLDGAVAEDYSCYVLKAGMPIKADLLTADPQALAARCHSKLAKMISSRKASFEHLDENLVCTAPNEISTKIKQMISGISKGEKCGPEDF